MDASLKNLREIDLDARAVNFLVDRLTGGYAISQLLARSLKSRAVRSWTLLPTYVNQNQVYRFDTGGICDIDPSEEFASMIHESLLAAQNLSWVLEDNTGYPSSRPKTKVPLLMITHQFHYDGGLFHLLRTESQSASDIQQTFKFGGANPFLGLLCRLNSSTKKAIIENSISAEEMLLIVENAEKVVVGAYDEETYIVVELS